MDTDQRVCKSCSEEIGRLLGKVQQLGGALTAERAKKKALKASLQTLRSAYEAVVQALQHGTGKPTKTLTKEIRFRIFVRDNFKCTYCGVSPAGGASLEIDHIVPVSAGGTNETDNLRTACRECNAGKRDGLFGLEQAAASGPTPATLSGNGISPQSTR